MRILDVRAQARSDYKERSQKTRIYFFQEGETLIENLSNRRRRKYQDYKAELLPTVLVTVKMAHGISLDGKIGWNQRAGCSCGCSPGFIVNDHYGYDIYVTYTYEPEYAV